MPAWHEAITGFDVLAVTLLVGTVAGLALWQPAAGAGHPLSRSLARRLAVLFALALGFLTLTSVAILFARTAAISGERFPQVADVVPLVLEKTDFGKLWLARVAAVLLMGLLWSWAGLRRQSATWILPLLVGVVAFSRSASGHAGDHGNFAWPVWIDWLHLVSAGLWGGSIVVFLLAVRPALLRHVEPGDGAAATIVRRYSMLAAAGLALAAATGVCSAWLRMGAWQPLWTTRYGLVLDAKLVLVIAMAILGATNRFRHVPAVLAAARSGDPRSWLRALRDLSLTSLGEAVLWLAIIAAVALLLSGIPPSSLPPIPAGATH